VSQASDLMDFSGQARLFPLPNFVMFPHVKKMFHVFEPRYRKLVVDALGTDRYLAIVQLAPGWERDYEGKPNVEPIGCLVRIEQHTLFLDGRYNLMVRGVCRVRLEQELLTSTPYRVFRVVPLLDQPDRDIPSLRAALRNAVRDHLGATSSAWRAMEDQFRADRPLAAVVDTVSFYLSLRPALKQGLLAELDQEQRGRKLLALVQGDPHNFETERTWEGLAPARPRIEPSAN
jgi:Lon protease-like protein